MLEPLPTENDAPETRIPLTLWRFVKSYLPDGIFNFLLRELNYKLCEINTLLKEKSSFPIVPEFGQRDSCRIYQPSP